MLINLFSLSLRVTKQYIRRIKSGRNFLYDKTIKRFEDLKEEEKNVIFYPKLSIVLVNEFVLRKETSKLYSTLIRCQ